MNNRKRNLTLSLWGHILRPQSADNRPFWRGFVQLQKQLPSDVYIENVVAHSWNPELRELASLVYNPIEAVHERQRTFYSEYINNITPPDLYESGLDRLKTIWRNISIQTVLGQARSRARSVSLLNKLLKKTEQVLIVRWDLGQTGEPIVNQLMLDSSLPSDYIYLANYSEVDEGYADMWIVTPWKYAHDFSDLDTFMLDTISNNESFVSEFSKEGWPSSRRRKYYEEWYWSSYARKYRPWIRSKITPVLKTKIKILSPIRAFIRKLDFYLSLPPITAETSFINESDKRNSTYPLYQALSHHVILKYFIIKKNLRHCTRFISRSDLNLEPVSGCLINPEPVNLIFFSIGQRNNFSLNEFKLPIKSMYCLDDEDNSILKYDFSINDWLNYANLDEDFKSLKLILEDIEESDFDGSPIITFPDLQKFDMCSDWYYLNALIKYSRWSDSDYIGFGDECPTKERDFYMRSASNVQFDFPDLKMKRGDGVLKFKHGLFSCSGLKAFCNSGVNDFVLFESKASKMALEFPVVEREFQLFNFPVR